MIVNFDNNCFTKFEDKELASLAYAVVKNYHFIDDIKSWSKLLPIAEKYCSTWQKEQIKSGINRLSHLTPVIRKYLTTITASDYSYKEIYDILTKPSYLMVENLPYEANVYKSIIGTYTKDKRYKSIFLLLDNAKKRRWLSFFHAGGFSTEKALLEYLDQNDYRNITKLKFCVLMDRDTDGYLLFPDSRNPLFKMLSGKDKRTLSNIDIYDNAFSSPYIWHMWYKRTIENYFPERVFMNVGINTNLCALGVADWNYKHIVERGGYKKKMLSDIAKGMSLNDYENNLQGFDVSVNNTTEHMSEMELFLLKLVKII